MLAQTTMPAKHDNVIHVAFVIVNEKQFPWSVDISWSVDTCTSQLLSDGVDQYIGLFLFWIQNKKGRCIGLVQNVM